MSTEADSPIVVSGARGQPAPTASTTTTVSVVIATRGGRLEMLERAVRSVAANGFTGPVHIVVVFDGTPPVDLGLRLPAGVDIATMVNTRPAGLAGARNCGLLAAGAEFVAFCDDDDEWLPGKLAAQVAVMRAHPGTLLVGCGITIVQNGRQFHRPAPTVVTHRELLRSRLMELHSSGVLLRRAELLERVGPVQEGLPGDFGEDYDLLLRVSALSPIRTVPQPSVRVHWHGTSYYFSRWQMIADALEVLLDQHPDFAEVPSGRGRIEGQIALARAATGRRREAVRWAVRSLKDSPAERRAYLALLVCTRVTDADTLQRMAHRFGRGL